MSLNALIEKVVGKQKERSKARMSDFRDIVAQIADGLEPDPDIVTDVLDNAGKNPEELCAVVELLQERRQLRKQLDALSKLTAERSKIERRIAAADAELEAADKKHAETVYPLETQIEQIKASIWTGEQSRTKLWETCADPNLRAQLEDVQAKLTEARKIESDKQTAIGDLYKRAKHLRVAAEQGKNVLGGEDRVEELIDSSKKHEKKGAEYEAELAKAQKARADLEIQEKAIRDLMLVP